MLLFAQMTFMNPIILAALLTLPVLWYILRITPPAPKTLFFPATRLLMGLVSDDNTASKSPWWLMLLRMIMLALIITALAKPVLNAADDLPTTRNIRLLIDNSWASAQNWDKVIEAANEIIEKAHRDKRGIYIVTTTDHSAEEQNKALSALSRTEAQSILRGLHPNPWPSDYAALLNALEQTNFDTSIHTFWLSHGLNEEHKIGDKNKLIKHLQHKGGLSYVRPSPANQPVIMRPSKATLSTKDIEKHGDIRIDIEPSPNTPLQTEFSIQAIGENSTLDAKRISLDNTTKNQTVFFDIPASHRNQISQFKINNRQGVGGIYLLDDQSKKRKVGIVSPTEEDAAPLIEASFYLKRALEPYADIDTGEISSLLDNTPSVIILPDITAIPSETLNRLEQWVKDGGLLLRFSGPNMAQSLNPHFLLPVTLRDGERSLFGALTWDDPQSIAPFTQDSPLYNLSIPNDIYIKQQLLADPAQDLEGKVWARLTDGTPFITASPLDRGLLVLVHTTANADWSDFALSGLYVSTLQRIIGMAGRSNSAQTQNYVSFDPVLVMDGYGNLQSPDASVLPIQADNLAKTIPDAQHPPGLYAQGAMTYALNLGDNLPKLKSMDILQIGVSASYYDEEYEVSLMPMLLYCALIIFCIDWFLMIFIIGNGRSLLQKIPFTMSLFALLLFFLPQSVMAADTKDMQYAKGFHLAYIQTGDQRLDMQTHKGLENLKTILTMRTSLVASGVAAIDLEHDSLTFFPIIYWPISPSQKAPSLKAIQKIQFYLDHGGTILFDTRDHNRATRTIQNSENSKALRAVTNALNVPALGPIKDDHVLSRSFYLLDHYPGYYKDGTFWVESLSASGRDNVSSILIGSNDWGKSWAEQDPTRPFDPYRSNTLQKQNELAYRFGVNLVMYALTGNYKLDQVHIPHILERLGK